MEEVVKWRRLNEEGGGIVEEVDWRRQLNGGGEILCIMPLSSEPGRPSSPCQFHYMGSET